MTSSKAKIGKHAFWPDVPGGFGGLVLGCVVLFQNVSASIVPIVVGCGLVAVVVMVVVIWGELAGVAAVVCSLLVAGASIRSPVVLYVSTDRSLSSSSSSSCWGCRTI